MNLEEIIDKLDGADEEDEAGMDLEIDFDIFGEDSDLDPDYKEKEDSSDSEASGVAR